MADSRAAKAGVLLRVSYDGTDLHGWAAQNNARTVAGDLQRALEVLDDQASVLRGASRTDAGVHSRGQLAAFNATRDIACKGWVCGINSNLPSDISVVSACSVPLDFNPRFHNRGKRYVYRIVQSKSRAARDERYAWRIESPLDLARISHAAAEFTGSHDFRAFCTEDRQGPKENARRRVHAVNVREGENGHFEIRVEGEAFLYNMVRIMVGTLLEIGSGKRDADAIPHALASKNRLDAGPTAPAHGLTLDEVYLNADITPTNLWP